MSLLLVLKGVSSVPFLSGAAITAMGLGVLPVDDSMWAVATQVIGKDTVSAQPFFVFLGVSKLLGVLGLWDKGPFAGHSLAVRCAVGIPPLCGAYGHYRLGETAQTIAALGFFVVFSIYQILEEKESSGKRKET